MPEHVVNITINTGYFADPKTIPGLAHLVEHVLMRGTDKQPGLQALLAQHHIKLEAHTSANKLLFTVSHINNDPLQIIGNMLHAICQFNATTTSVATEITTIAQEFISIQSDAIRAIQEVSRETCNPEHPFAKFPTGNAETFAEHSIEALTLGVNAWLEQHIHPRNIDIHIICAEPSALIDISILADLLPEPQNCYARTVKYASVQHQGHCLSQQPNPPLYLENQQGVELLIATHTTQPRLILSFAVDITHISDKDIGLFLFLLNFPPLTSIPQQLIEQGLVRQYHVDTGLHVGATLEVNINIALTELGLTQHSRIITLWLYFLAHQQTQSIPNVILHQLNQALAWRECFSDEVALPWPQWFEQLSLKNSICDGASSTNPLKPLFSQCNINKIRSLLLANTALMPACGQPSYQSRWYNTEYQVRPFTHSSTRGGATDIKTMTDLSDPLINDISVDLFVLNSFIATLPVRESIPISKTPQLFANSLLCRHFTSAHHDLYQQKVKTNDKPIVEMFLALETMRSDAASIIAKRIWVSGIEDKLATLKYSFTMIGGNIKIYPNQTGLTLLLACPQPLLVNLLTQILTLLTEPLLLLGNFAILHQQHTHNLLQRRPVTAYQAAFSQLSEHLCQQPDFYEYEQMNVIQALDIQQIADYHREFFANCYAEGLVFGNADEAELQQVNELLEHLTQVKKTTFNQQLQRPMERVLLTHSNYANSCFVTLLLTREKTLKATILGMALAEILAEPFFERFRQELQIGYDIGSGFITHQQHPGISFYLNYSTHSVMDIYHYQVAFFTQMRQALPHFEVHWPMVKQSLCHQLNPQHLGFSQQAQYCWMQMGRLGGINHDTQLVALLQDIEFDEFLAFSLDLLDITKEDCIFSISSHNTDCSVNDLKRQI